jgi:DNA-binding beta-propeller fold protein YncE
LFFLRVGKAVKLRLIGAVIVLALLAAGIALGAHDLNPLVRGPARQAASVSGQFIYAAQDDGTIRVYDIDHAHRLVKVIRVFACCADVRGVTAAAPTHRLYVMYNQGHQGHLAAIDLLTDQVLWDHVLHAPGVDRGNITPDGKTIYLPTWESDPNAPYELVVDALTGNAVGKVALPPRSHDTIVSLDGKHVFMETKSATAAMYVADTATNQIVETISGYCCSGVLAPFAINGSDTLVVNDVNGYNGFQIASITTGRAIASVPFGAGGTGGHGIAWTPDEREVWVNDGGGPFVHVFEMTTMPPQQTQLVRVSNPSPHWVTFSIDGRYAYVAGRKGTSDPTDVIDTRTYQRIGTLSPSEDLLEVDFQQGAVSQVGDQFGIGRVTGPDHDEAAICPDHEWSGYQDEACLRRLRMVRSVRMGHWSGIETGHRKVAFVISRRGFIRRPTSRALQRHCHLIINRPRTHLRCKNVRRATFTHSVAGNPLYI